MLDFEGFPEDDAFWMVKCIDRFRLPHAATESASVDVRLQRVDRELAVRAARVKPREIQSVLGRSDRPPGDFRTVAVHVGSLPALRVGQIFHRGRFTAELPGTVRTLELPNAEMSCTAWNLNTQVGAGPDGWDPKLPYGVLMSREFDLGEADLRGHRVLGFKGPHGQDVLIPRMVIFQCFYGPQTEMADALTSGPWTHVQHRLVSTADFENGLKTREVREANEWHLVLATLIRNDFRWHVALLYFDPYGKVQARRLHGEAEAQRRKRPDHSWFCTATLPFDPRYPLGLKVHGYTLSPSKWRPEGAFLVTSILSATPGQPLPILAYGRANDGEDAPEVIEVEKRPPYSGKSSLPEGGSAHRPVTSLYAPPTGGAVAQYSGDTFAWGGELKERVLQKQSSKRYTGAPLRPPVPGGGPDSTAKPVAGGQAGRHASVSTQAIPPVEHFDNLIRCLRRLRDDAFLHYFQVVQPTSRDARAMRATLHVWDLTERDVKHANARPKRRWRMLNWSRDAENPVRGRTVLVLEVAWKNHIALLFEVECRTSERGYRMAALVFRADANVDTGVASENMISAIIKAHGRYLDDAAARVAANLPDVHGAAFRHRYRLDEQGKKVLEADALKAFLIRNESCKRHPVGRPG